jgi:EpsG family
LLVYWLLFGFFAAGSLLRREPLAHRSVPILLIVGALLVWLAIGFRYEVGGDWVTYKFLFSFARVASLSRALAIGDPGYQILNWAAQRAGAEIWFVNLVCGAIFTWGMYRFARVQPDPWLTFVVAVPYLIIVVAMGYSRQAVAIGVLMAGLAAVKRGGSMVRFAAYVAVAALFHKTAVVVLPLVVFAWKRNTFLNALAGIAGCILLYDIFLSQSVEGFVRNYIEAEYSSQGAAIRVAMNFVPAVCFLLFRRRLRFDPTEERLWFYFALASLVMPIALYLLPSSTAVDRLALYLIPLQVAVLPRVPFLFAGPGFGRAVIVAYAAAVQFTWLNFAAHAQGWIPYKSYLF